MIEAANPAALKLFHCKYGDLKNRNLKTFFRAKEIPVDFSLQGIDWETSKEMEATATRPDGQKFPAEIIVCLFSTPDAEKLLVLIEDVSARHEVERLKEEFLSMVSHDMRAPLTSIQLFLDLMASGTYSNNYQGAVRMAGKVEASAKRLINMINGLLDMQKMEAGRLNMFLDVVDCSEIVDHCVDSLETLAQTSQITLTPFMGGDVQVLADRDYVIQVLVNLISNAIKFSPPGKSVDIRVEPNEKMVTIKVIDQGPGIGEEFRKRMFNRFEQAHISDQRVKGGTGLGLAIAKAIIEQHGGEIGVDSEEGFGSTFWFTLQSLKLILSS